MSDTDDKNVAPPFADMGVISNTDDAMAKLMAVMDEDGKPLPKGEAPVENNSAQADRGQPAQPAEPEEGAKIEPEPQVPSLEPPRSWSKEAREAWASLTPEAKQIVLKRETERDAELRRGQNEIAEQRKALEAERQRVISETQAALGNLPQLRAALEQRLVNEEWVRLNPKDWENLSVNDPAKYVALKAKAENDISAWQQTIQTQAALEQRAMQETQQRLSQFVQAEQQKLAEKWPEFVNPQTANDQRAKLVSYAKEVGFTEQDLAQIYDHRLLMIVKDAMEARALREASKSANARVQNLPPVSQPGARPGDNDGQRRGGLISQLQKARSTEAQARILEQLLPDD